MRDFVEVIENFEFERDANGRPLIPSTSAPNDIGALARLLVGARVDHLGSVDRNLDHYQVESLRVKGFSIVAHGDRQALAHDTQTESEYARHVKDLAVAAFIRSYPFAKDDYGRPKLPPSSYHVNGIDVGQILYRAKVRAAGKKDPNYVSLLPEAAKALRERNFNVIAIGDKLLLPEDTPTSGMPTTRISGVTQPSMPQTRISAPVGPEPFVPSYSGSRPVPPVHQHYPTATAGAGPSRHEPVARPVPTPVPPAVATASVSGVVQSEHHSLRQWALAMQSNMRFAARMYYTRLHVSTGIPGQDTSRPHYHEWGKVQPHLWTQPQSMQLLSEWREELKSGAASDKVLLDYVKVIQQQRSAARPAYGQAPRREAAGSRQQDIHGQEQPMTPGASAYASYAAMLATPSTPGHAPTSGTGTSLPQYACAPAGAMPIHGPSSTGNSYGQQHGPQRR
ncbi:hypothetical protein AB0E04_39595 [Streptomyces sp. NPDC048251]|uniref:hypothetical protein n=1 Tax=Streptomyces sp. NPDC048251 TaxID=3154501 RepID=UPI003440EDC8